MRSGLRVGDPRPSGRLARPCEEFREDGLRSEEFDLPSGHPTLSNLDALFEVLDPNLCHLDFEGEGAGFVSEEGLAWLVHIVCLVHL